MLNKGGALIYLQQAYNKELETLNKNIKKNSMS